MTFPSSVFVVMLDVVVGVRHASYYVVCFVGCVFLCWSVFEVCAVILCRGWCLGCRVWLLCELFSMV